MRLTKCEIRAAPRRLIDELRAAGLLRLPRFVLTSSFRLTLLYTALFGVSALVLSGLVWWIATGYVAGQIDAAVSTEIAEERADANGTLAGLKEVVQAQAQHASQDAYYLLQDASGRVLAGNLPPTKAVLGIREWELPSGVEVRGRGVAAPDGGYSFVGMDASNLRELRHAIGYAFLWVIFGTLLLAVIGGTVMSFGVLGRVEAISRASRRIVAGDLDQRIALRGTNDELDHLAASLNTMLDRIQALMSSLRQVSSDIAHDLRTPLSRHRQRLELALLAGRTEQDLRVALEASLADVDAILETFSALLRIARLEARADPPPFTALELGALAEDVVEAYRAVAEERQQNLSCSAYPVLVQGSRELLTQLVANLIENALRHAPVGACVQVSVKLSDGAPVLRVCDDGPGIPAEFRAAVFRPFYRLEASRTTPGTGLGLSLVAAIAEMHTARVTLSDNCPGLCVEIFFGPEPTADLKDPLWVEWISALLHRWVREPYASRSVTGLRYTYNTTSHVVDRLRQGRGTVPKSETAEAAGRASELPTPNGSRASAELGHRHSTASDV